MDTKSGVLCFVYLSVPLTRFSFRLHSERFFGEFFFDDQHFFLSSSLLGLLFFSVFFIANCFNILIFFGFCEHEQLCFSCFVADYGSIWFFVFFSSGNFNTFTNCIFFFHVLHKLVFASFLFSANRICWSFWVTLITRLLLQRLNCFTLVSNDFLFLLR